MSNGYARPAKNGTLLYLSAPPVDGKANARVERFLADLLSLPRSSVSVERGAASENKTVLLRNTDPRYVHQTLSTLLS